MIVLPLLILAATLYWFWWGKASKPSPFACETRRPRAPLETDYAKRYERLKQAYTPSAVPGSVDAIVIGRYCSIYQLFNSQPCLAESDFGWGC